MLGCRRLGQSYPSFCVGHRYAGQMAVPGSEEWKELKLFVYLLQT